MFHSVYSQQALSGILPGKTFITLCTGVYSFKWLVFAAYMPRQSTCTRECFIANFTVVVFCKMGSFMTLQTRFG